MQIYPRLSAFVELTRLDKPIGILLLLWPTLTALWLANAGKPPLKLLIIFGGGVCLMRAAGCILNDLADRKFDGQVTRTQQRPLVSGKASVKTAIIWCVCLLLLALCLVLQLNQRCILLAGLGVLLTTAYPFAKRFTYLPQLVLGVTFNLGILMAFVALMPQLPTAAWLLYVIALLWTVAYDTQYAMADRIDDIKIGVKSTAILFGNYDRLIISLLHVSVILLLSLLGQILSLNKYYYLGVLGAGLFFIYQSYLIRNRDPKHCFQAFLNNNWAWLAVFIGVVLNYFVTFHISF